VRLPPWEVSRTMRVHSTDPRMADPQETKPPLRRRILGRRDAMDPRPGRP
jgi:hypothetical protein